MREIDITEECDRATSHIEQFKEYANQDGPIGKKMKFLTQELHRELNTIGAKADDSDISHLIVETKNELEKIKEQKPNLVVLDLMLPRTDGFDICKKIRNDDQFNKLPIIIFCRLFFLYFQLFFSTVKEHLGPWLSYF